MRVGIKSGAFSLLHKGHFWCIQECAKQVDYLILLTNDNEYILNKKGCIPIPLEDRLYMLNNIKGVNEVGYFSGNTEHFWIKNFKENRLTKEFGDAKLIIFHSDELKDLNNGDLPGYGLADEIIFIEKINKPESVSSIFKTIKDII